MHVSNFAKVPGQPFVEESNGRETTISISWSVPIGSVVEQYEVEWSSHQCSDGPIDGSSTLIGAATNFTIEGLRAGTEYNVSVTAINSAGNFTSDVLNIHTLEMGECIAGIQNNYALVLINYFDNCSAIVLLNNDVKTNACDCNLQTIQAIVCA